MSGFTAGQLGSFLGSVEWPQVGSGERERPGSCCDQTQDLNSHWCGPMVLAKAQQSPEDGGQSPLEGTSRQEQGASAQARLEGPGENLEVLPKALHHLILNWKL